MDVCQEKCIHKDAVEKTVQTLPDAEIAGRMAEIFKALSDPTRLKIVLSLLNSEHCVCDIAAICQQTDSAVSHQLRLLRAYRIVKNRREGKIVYYSLDDTHVSDLIQISLNHAEH